MNRAGFHLGKIAGITGARMRSPNERERNAATTAGGSDGSKKSESSSSFMTAKKVGEHGEGSSQDICASKSVSDGRDETALKGGGNDAEGSETGKAETSMSKLEKEGGSGGKSGSKENPSGWPEDVKTDWNHIEWHSGINR